MPPRPLKRPRTNDLLLGIFYKKEVFFLRALGAIVLWCHRGAMSIAQIAAAVAVTASILHRAFGFPCKRAVFTPALASSANYA